jgi:hypothetical protein
LATSLAQCTPYRATTSIKKKKKKKKSKKPNMIINILDEGKPTYNEGIA